MSLAAETRAAVRAHPFLYDALRAGVVNYTAAARYLDLGDEEAVAAALRRYAQDLPAPDAGGDGARLSMRRDLGRADGHDEALLVAGNVALAPGEGGLTGVQAVGDVDAGSLGRTLRRLAIADVDVTAAAATDGTLLVVVESRAGADALRAVEDAVG